MEVVGHDVPSSAIGRFGQVIQTQTLGSAVAEPIDPIR
jgi:hypothetical protein